jgi:hypothetical protein
VIRGVWKCLFATIATILLLATPVFAVELFRYRGAAKDGGTLEYVFETDQQDVPATATKDKVAETAANFMTTFYGIQIGALEAQELRTKPVPFWLVASSDTVRGPIKEMYLVVVLPGDTVVEPGVAKRL